MVGASKILTVSYGTFSCTLEGFDDPFSTMKAIAEYFRDLAANDRFFGAEPPTPDVQMLHSIAQQNSEAPVDAKVEEGGLRLTQADTPKPDAEKPRRKKKHKNKNKKKKRRAKRAAAISSVAIMGAGMSQEIDNQADVIETVETEVEDAVTEVEDTPASAFEMFLDENTASDAEATTGDQVEETGIDESHDDAISALLADETALVEEDTPETSDVAEVVLTDFAVEDVADEPDTTTDNPELAMDLDEDTETEVVVEDGTVDADHEDAGTDPIEDPVAEIGAEIDEVASSDEAEDISDETTETVVALDFAEDEDVAPEQDTPEFTPVPAVNRFAPVEQTVAEIEGLASIEQTAEPFDSVTSDEDTDTEEDSDQVTTEIDIDQESMDSDEIDSVDLDTGSNVTAFSPIEPMDGDEATAENMFTEDVNVEQGESTDFDNEVAALFAVDEGQDNDADASELDDQGDAGDLQETEAEDESTSKRGLLSAASIAAKLQRIRAVVTSSVGGGDNTLATGETTDEDTLEEDGEVASEPVWSETTEKSEDAAEWADTAETEANDDADDTESDAFASDGQRGPLPIEVSDDDLAAAAEISSSVGSHRPEVFKQTLESLNRDEPSSLSEEDEADLISQLAEASEFAEENSKDGRAILEGDAIEKEEEALERLLEQTNSRLNEDTTQRRQSALSHLKAAVAATIADRNDSQTPVEEDPNKDADSDYRNDLADIVRPKRVTKEERATNSTVAPLVLVPQAKVEEDETTEAAEPVSFDIPEGGVRPRRISRDEMAATNADVDTGFSDYAEQVGANDLKELLEAAAAYLNKVEGKPHFSRPQVMHIVMRHDPERSFSREDSLRSFGELLRNGAIEKVDRGQFVISNESKFLAAS